MLTLGHHYQIQTVLNTYQPTTDNYETPYDICTQMKFDQKKKKKQAITTDTRAHKGLAKTIKLF